ncbi:MAG TPA: hypothetical protein P5080_03510 [Candidatus Paceibacterota bacterium]|nr:hypothetical protein [Candidatus Pacearchaeota archaeon]HRZ51088.1 hypothetical protein [Candidatus Paceibacterota bacterium]HSA36753.1 hypothetical protein [Candidatus Paceibacterota bacterium]
MKKSILKFSAALAALLFPAVPASAVCPVCTVAVGAGVGLSRWLGIDDSIAGLWIGGLTVSLIVWTISWLNKKNKHFPFRNTTVAFGYLLMMIVPLYYAKIIASPYAFLCSCARDLLVLGIATGGSGFYFGALLYEHLKTRNGGHAYFPFQKVVMPILPLLSLTVVFYLLTR